MKLCTLKTLKADLTSKITPTQIMEEYDINGVHIVSPYDPVFIQNILNNTPDVPINGERTLRDMFLAEQNRMLGRPPLTKRGRDWKEWHYKGDFNVALLIDKFLKADLTTENLEPFSRYIFTDGESLENFSLVAKVALQTHLQYETAHRATYFIGNLPCEIPFANPLSNLSGTLECKICGDKHEIIPSYYHTWVYDRHSDSVICNSCWNVLRNL